MSNFQRAFRRRNQVQDEMPEQLRLDAANAFNILRHRGKLPLDAAFNFVKKNGKWHVAIWRPDKKTGGTIGGVALIDPRELIVAADKLPVVRGLGEFVE